MKMGFSFHICFIISSATSSVARPQISTTFSLRSPSVIRPCCQRSWIFVDLQLEAVEDLALAGRRDDVVLRDGHTRAGRVGEAEVLDGVEHRRHLARAVDVDEAGDEVADLTLGERPVLPLVRLAVDRLGQLLVQRALDRRVEDHAAGRGDQLLAGRRAGT